MGYNPSYFSENGPGSACGPTCPVEQVSWHELAAYANALSALDGREDCYECHGTGGDVRCTAWEDLDKPSDCLGYRLPTEAEWEYAARAGSTTATYHGNLDSTDCDNTVLDAIAWYGCNASRLTHPVGQKADNALGLHDMLGNVWEWCHDWSAPYPGGPETDPAVPDEGIFRVVRGSSWFYSARLTRAAHRDEHDPDDHYMQNGGRVVRSAP